MKPRIPGSPTRGGRTSGGSAAMLAALLTPLHFTAPADLVGPDHQGHTVRSDAPVHAYHFQRRRPGGETDSIPGFRDSLGHVLLSPGAPGTREVVWVPWQDRDGPVEITVRSSDVAGNRSESSNPWTLADAVPGRLALARPSSATQLAPILLDVPNLVQRRERCGQASLAMVLRFYGADASALQQVESAYDPVLHGSLITDLAGAARRAGYRADIQTLTADTLIAFLERGVPVILLYQNGSGPVTVRHFGVLIGWDASHATFTLHDGTSTPRKERRDELQKRWNTAGSQALVVTRMTP